MALTSPTVTRSAKRSAAKREFCQVFDLIGGRRQDSNLQPDRYERPALTIELQAPPRAGIRVGARQRCRHRLQGEQRSCGALGFRRHLGIEVFAFSAS